MKAMLVLVLAGIALSFMVSFAVIALPATLPVLLLTSSKHQILNDSTAAIGPQPFLPALSGNRPSQFALGLNPYDAYAACGPTAAIAMGRWFGVELPVTRVMGAAVSGLWDANTGMYGVGAEKSLLDRLGLATRLEVPINWQHVFAELSVGRPVILDTPGHYYYADALDGQYLHVGTSGTDLRNGYAWMTAYQINVHPVSQGAVRAAIYAATAPPEQ